jgi:hypothetical protein
MPSPHSDHPDSAGGLRAGGKLRSNRLKFDRFRQKLDRRHIVTCQDQVASDIEMLLGVRRRNMHTPVPHARYVPTVAAVL